MSVASPLKWHGGKSYLASKIIELMPPHLTYCEPFFGGGSVMLAKPFDGINEVANDLNRWLACFWGCMMNPEEFAKLQRYVEGMPFSEELWDNATRLPSRDPALIDRNPASAAAAFFVRCRQSLAGRMDSFAPLSRTRTRRRMNEQVSAWLTAVEGLPAVHERLKRVAVTNRPAVKVIKDLDDPQTLFYCDPPYLKSTRTAPEVYEHEMDYADHEELLATLSSIKGRFILSGYPSELYETAASEFGWKRVDIEIDNKAASGAEKRKMVECLWMNF